MITKENEELIKRLSEVIKATRLSKSRFAQLADISNVGRKVSGEVSITEADVLKVCKTFGVNYDWLKCGIGEMGSTSYSNNKVASYTPQGVIDVNPVPYLEQLIKPYLEQLIKVMSNTGSLDMINKKDGEINSLKVQIESLKESISHLNAILEAKNETIRILMKILDDNGIKI